MEVLGEVSRTGVITPAELAARMHVRVQSLTDSINELVSRGLVSRRPDDDDRRRQLIEITAAGTALLDDDRAERDAWLNATMRDNLTELEFNLLMLVAPVLRKLAYAEGKVGTLTPMTGGGSSDIVRTGSRTTPTRRPPPSWRHAATRNSRSGSPVR